MSENAQHRDPTPRVRPAMPAVCVFDLDGTLIDSLRDIAEALNECLELLGLPTFPVERYRYMVGEGVPKLCERAAGATHPQYVPRLVELVRARYRVRPLRHTAPYAGVRDLVAAVRARGIACAVLSNKPHELTTEIVQQFWPDGEFAIVQGYVTERLRKPDPTHLLEICAALRVSPDRCWMIGDTPTDIATAHNAGAQDIGVTWGFRTRGDLKEGGATVIVDRPDEVITLLDAAVVGGDAVDAASSQRR